MVWGRHCDCGDGCRRFVQSRESDDAGPSRSAGTGEIFGGARVVGCEPPLTGAGSIVGSIRRHWQPARARTPRHDRRDLEVPALRRGRAGPDHRPTACRDCAQWRVSARFVCGSARRFGPVPAMTETAFGDLPLYRCGRSMLVRAPLVLRLRVFLVRWSLDRRIAAGCSCDSSAMLNLRARQLIRRRARQGLAWSLRDVVAYVDRDGSRRSFSTVVIRRGAVRADRARTRARSRCSISATTFRLPSTCLSHVDTAGCARRPASSFTPTPTARRSPASGATDCHRPRRRER